ncbi:MAG TPA: right-handed parallel beta-helix repeat-containing protein [Pyrinomonadaceae bacterium]
MSKVRFTLNILAVAIFTLTVASMAQAQATRTWVSGVGDDANPCSRTAPCKTFAGAISKTATAGEISVLDPGGFGAINITKSITLNGDGTLAGVLNSLVNGVIVNPGTTGNVTLRNLSIKAPDNGLDGVKIFSGKNVTIENVTIEGQQIGIEVVATAGVNVNIINTSIKNCTTAGVRSDTSAGLARVTMRNSTITNSVTGFNARRNTRASLLDSTINFNTVGVHVEGNGGVTVALMKGCQVSNNTSHGIQAGGGAATSNSVARIGENLINNNGGAGVSIQANGTVDTFLNNEINGNTPDGCVGCNNVTGTLN